MARRFREHDLRGVTDLRGMWDFAFLGEVEPDDVDVSAIRFNDVMAVPGCFDATPAYAGKRGLAAYRTRVLLPKGGRQWLVLDGVHHWCRVCADRRAIGDHAGGFTRFPMDFEARAGEVEIVVLVDNRFNYERCPLHVGYFDWYQYGGIARGAELHSPQDPFIESLSVATSDWSSREITLTVRCRASAQRRGLPLTATFGDAVVVDEPVDVAAGVCEFERSFRVPGAPLWSPDAPNLHLLHLRLGDDDVRERVGIRQVWTEGRKILLNGEPVRLLGVNRHESHPQFGHGLPDSVLLWDAQLIRDLGGNFVRGSHYPQDGRWLDLCDELGLMVWCESTGWQHGAEHLNDSRFMQAQLTNVEEMVAVAQTHPSVIMYGVLNEGRSGDPACRRGYETLLSRLRQLDPTRPLTYASCWLEEDVCFDLVDLIAMNDYPGWYHHTVSEIPAVLDEDAATVDGKGFAGKPLMVSEIGAEALWGWRDWNAERWSEQHQAAVVDAGCKHVLFERDRWCGIAIWQFCDVRSSEEVGRALSRARGFNNKGIVDEYRRPKMAYDVVRRHFRAARGKS